MKPEDKLISIKDPFAPEREALLQDLISSRKQTTMVNDKLRALQLYLQEREQSWRVEKENLKQALHHASTTVKNAAVAPSGTATVPRFSSIQPSPELRELRAENKRLRYRLTSYEHTLQSYANHAFLPSTTSSSSQSTDLTPYRRRAATTPRTPRARSSTGISSSVLPFTARTPTPTDLRQKNEQLQQQIYQLVREKNEAVQLLTEITNEAKRNALLIQQLISRLNRYESVENITVPNYDHLAVPVTTSTTIPSTVGNETTTHNPVTDRTGSTSNPQSRPKSPFLSTPTPRKPTSRSNHLAKSILNTSTKTPAPTAKVSKKTTPPVPPPYVKRTGSTVATKPPTTVISSLSSSSSSSVIPSSNETTLVSMAKLLAEGKLNPDSLDDDTRTRLLDQLQNLYSQQIIQTSNQISMEKGTVKVISMDLRKPDGSSSNLSTEQPSVSNRFPYPNPSHNDGNPRTNPPAASITTTDYTVPIVPAWLANINKNPPLNTSTMATNSHAYNPPSHPSNVNLHNPSIDNTPIRSFGP